MEAVKMNPFTPYTGPQFTDFTNFVEDKGSDLANRDMEPMEIHTE